MKASWKTALIGSVLWLSGSVFSLLQAQDQTLAIPPELTKAGEAMVLALNQKEIDKAFDVMTDKGANHYMAIMLIQLSQISQLETAGAQENDYQQLKKGIEKYGLDKFEFEMPIPDRHSAPEKIMSEILTAMDAAEKKILDCIPANVRRKAITEMLTAMSKFVDSPMSLRLGEFELRGDQAEAPVLGSVNAEVVLPQNDEAMPEVPIEYLLFTKKDGLWRFDGFNRKRMVESALNAELSEAMAQPFKEITDLSIMGKTIDDQPVSLAAYKGKVVLVDFWGTWCGPCVASLPKLRELHSEYNSKGFEILGVAADNADSLKSFLANKPLGWKNIVDVDAEIAGKYSIDAFPTTLLIDKQGKHVATNLRGETLVKAIGLLLEDKSVLSITGSAQQVLDAGKESASKEQKLIFLHFGATWCGPCRKLEEWMSQPEIRSMLDKIFVDVKIDNDSNLGAKELLTEFSPSASGIPWYAILKSTDSKPISTCENDKGETIGFPDATEGIDHFVKMFEVTGKFSKAQLEQIRSSIKDVVNPTRAEAPK